MEVLVVLLVSFVLLRGVGLLGVERLSSWRNAGLGALAIMFLVTSTAHFNAMKHDLAAMMPDPLPNGLWTIYLTGVFEIAGAIGLLVPRTRRLAGIGLMLLLVAVFLPALNRRRRAPVAGRRPAGEVFASASTPATGEGRATARSWRRAKGRSGQIGLPEGGKMGLRGMTDLRILGQRPEEVTREVKRNRLAKALRAARKRRSGQRSAAAWETKRHAGRLAKLLKSVPIPRRSP
jgi:uncharacterized membrane protein